MTQILDYLASHQWIYAIIIAVGIPILGFANYCSTVLARLEIPFWKCLAFGVATFAISAAAGYFIMTSTMPLDVEEGAYQYHVIGAAASPGHCPDHWVDHLSGGNDEDVWQQSEAHHAGNADPHLPCSRDTGHRRSRGRGSTDGGDPSWSENASEPGDCDGGDSGWILCGILPSPRRSKIASVRDNVITSPTRKRGILPTPSACASGWYLFDIQYNSVFTSNGFMPGRSDNNLAITPVRCGAAQLVAGFLREPVQNTPHSDSETRSAREADTQSSSDHQSSLYHTDNKGGERIAG